MGIQLQNFCSRLSQPQVEVWVIFQRLALDAAQNCEFWADAVLKTVILDEKRLGDPIA